MKILKDIFGRILVIGSCSIEKSLRKEDHCTIYFYGATGGFSNNSTMFEIQTSIEKLENFLISDEKVLDCNFMEKNHSE